ncbi:MAG: hypothetical protein EA357_09245 [Micavibrio sp.]|nr:MAG: hypothetical protein EA357_09245 [Micavibrio sp.]
MPKYSREQVKTFEEIVDSFINNVVKSVGNTPDGKTPGEVFSKNIKFTEMPKILIARNAFNRGAADPDKRVKQILKYCSSVLPAMQRSFGDEALSDAVPQTARTQEIADICRENGAEGIAKLVDAAIAKDQPAGQKTPAAKNAGGKPPQPKK